MKDLDLLTDEELLRLSPYTIEELEASERLGKCPIIPHRREQEFLDLEAEEVLFGGAVGGGKTEAGMLWLADGVQHSNFSGLFLRRTFSQLQGSPTSPIERSYKFFSQMGGRFSGSGWKFPNGAVVRFGHMQYENDKHSYDGHEFHRCVERRTPVLMADGSWKPICDIKTGDRVKTLEGPRSVQAVWNVGKKPVIRATTKYGSALISCQHRVLTSFGWVAPSELQTTASRRAEASCIASVWSPLASHTPSELKRSCLSPASTIDGACDLAVVNQGYAALTKGERIDCEAFDGEHQGRLRLQRWNALAVLYAPLTQSQDVAFGRQSLLHAPIHESDGCVVQGCRGDCQACLYFGGEQFRETIKGGQACTPSLGDVAAQGHGNLQTDDHGSIPSRSPDRLLLPHPYTSRHLDVCEDVHLDRVEMALEGEAELMDLSVEDSCHYIVSGGIIASNCFFDQVEQFSETQYTYMFSRLRRIVGFPLTCGIRSSANPVGGHWVRQRFVSQQAIDELKKYTANDPSPPGMKFECPGTEGYFLPSRIADNPSLEVDEYIARLRTRLGSVLAAKLANGDWSAIEGAVVDQDDLRYYTQRGEILTVMTGERNLSKDSRTMRRIATIDTAGTSQQKANEQRGKPPSWSVCAIWDYWPEVGLFLRHIWRKRAGWHDLRSGVKATLDNWGKPQVYIENAHHGPPLAAEIPGAKLVSTAISRGSNVKTNAKYDRAVASGLLGWITDHKLYLPDPATVAGTADWMPEFEAELLSWTGHPDETADQIDVCSHAVHQVRSTGKSWGGVVKTKKARVGAKRW